jgi:hypothetical protein
VDKLYESEPTWFWSESSFMQPYRFLVLVRKFVFNSQNNRFDCVV